MVMGVFYGALIMAIVGICAGVDLLAENVPAIGRLFGYDPEDND